MKQNLANDQKFNQRIADYYQRAIDQINRTIDENANLIVDEKGNHTGYQPVTAGQMASYQREAKHVVQQANQMRAEGKTPTYGDWTDAANNRMQVYNATMRINRLELLKSQVGLHLTEATTETDKTLTAKLSDDYIKECKRQAGIMEVTAQPSMWTGPKVAKIVMAQTNSATFSDRLWANQDALKARLDAVISNGVIQGQSPRKVAKLLKSQVKTTVTNQRYVTERIARTESARVQFSAQMDSIKANGYEYVQWFAEIKACAECVAIARKDNGWGPGVYKLSKVPEIPVHPNCRCSISETVVEENTDADLLNKYTNDDMVKMLGKKVALQFAKGLDEAPEPLRKMYSKYAKTFKIEAVETDSSERCFYRPSTKGVTLNTRVINMDGKNLDRKPVDVVYHELGHLIDDRAFNGEIINRSGESMASRLGLSFDADKDWQTYNENLVKDIHTKADLMKVANPHTYSSDYYYGGVKLSYKKDGTFTLATRRNLGAQLHFDELHQEVHDKGWLAYTDVSDMVEATTGGKYQLGYGHGKRYWKYHGMQDKEFFAECSSATINNPESLAVIKKHFPNAYQKYLKIVDLINEKGKV